MSFTVVIPARFQSVRLPGKPLADLGGCTMIERVYRRASQSSAEKCVVATDDTRIADAVMAFGGDVVMTRDDHPSGTDRVQEICESLQLGAEDIVVNVQGDEPFLPVAVIEQVAGNLAEHSPAGIATLCTRIQDERELFDPNTVKVVRNEREYALYFSRAPIPWHRREFAEHRGLPADTAYFRHLGVYAYRVETLSAYVDWPRAPAEEAESLEQLRALHHGVLIHCAQAAERVPPGIDTPADLEQARRLVAQEH